MVSRGSADRPFGVVLLSVWSLLVGVAVFALAATYVYGLGQIPRALYDTFRGFPDGLVLIAAAVMVLQLLTAYGLWTLRWWGRLLAYGFAIVGIGAGMLTLPFGLVGVLLSLATAGYLTEPRVRALFRGPRAPTSTAK